MKRELLAGVLTSACMLAIACSNGVSGQKSGVERSAPDLMIQYGCPTCHVIPSVPGANGKVGPSLESISQRSYLAGVLPNTPQNLVQWIMHPQHFQPGTASTVGFPATFRCTFVSDSHQNG